MKYIKEADFSQASDNVNFGDSTNKELLDIPIIGEHLKKYLLITNHPERFENINSTEKYYNRYYWYLKFSIAYKNKYGYDAGVEQQEFRILEDGESLPDIDWNEIERISNELKK